MLPADPSQRPWIVAVARTHRSGLEAAQDLAAQARAGLLPRHSSRARSATAAGTPIIPSPTDLPHEHADKKSGADESAKDG